MSDRVKRPYTAPRRAAAAAQTLEAILAAAKERFETNGWAGTTIRAIATDANVSQKTIEVLFGTKASLLQAVVRYAIRGDTGEQPMAERETGRAVEAAPDAAAMLERHAAHAAEINSRSARIAWVVETAATSDDRVWPLWAEMTKNRRFGAHWAAEAYLQKSGACQDLTQEDAARIFLIGIDWATHRTLTGECKLTPMQAQQWIHDYYKHMLLPSP